MHREALDHLRTVVRQELVEHVLAEAGAQATGADVDVRRAPVDDRVDALQVRALRPLEVRSFDQPRYLLLKMFN